MSLVLALSRKGMLTSEGEVRVDGLKDELVVGSAGSCLQPLVLENRKYKRVWRLLLGEVSEDLEARDGLPPHYAVVSRVLYHCICCPRFLYLLYVPTVCWIIERPHIA